MAVLKHRKLFPYAPVSINQTDCPDFCYPYADPELPPPPPIYVIDQDDPNHNNMSPYVVLSVSLLASLLILIGYYVMVVKSCKNLCGSSGSSQSQSSISDEEDFLAENQVDNPVWFISTVGLQQAIINSIAVCRYKQGEGLIDGTECSVCLNEFQDDEMLRLLPKCSHAFHIPCIDIWLRSHTNCPLCRANIMCVRPSSDGLETIEESQMENSDTVIELDVNSEMGLLDRVGENRTVTENEREENEATQKDAHGNYCILELVKNVQNAEKLHLDAARKRHVSIGQCLHISPVLMKRSFACGGRLRFLSSRRKWSVISILGM